MPLFLLALFLFLSGLSEVSVFAEFPQNPHDPGLYQTETVEFPNLQDSKRALRKIPVKVHLPTSDGLWPVVVLSHGGGGGWDANFAQAQHLASHGYAVLCPEHIGSNTARLKRGLRFVKNLKDMTRDASEVLGRPKDISFVLDRAEEWNRSEPRLKGRLDLEHVGVLGHSFGAYTTLAVCGARPALNWLQPLTPPGTGLGPDLRDARVDAGVALSPQGPGEPFFLESSYASVDKPLLGITGSKDDQQTAPAKNRKRFFQLIPPGDKYFIWMENVDHLAFSDPTGSKRPGLRSRSRKDAQPIVRAATLLFFETYLRGNHNARRMLTTEAFAPLVRGVVTNAEVLKK